VWVVGGVAPGPGEGLGLRQVHGGDVSEVFGGVSTVHTATVETLPASSFLVGTPP
jgi:hypothetical protein